MVENRALEPGRLVGEQYRIVALLDQGGHGVVYEVEQLTTGRHRALKIMLPFHAATAALRTRFEREARIGARIPSDHVIEVTDAGYDASLQLPFLVMELLEGETLARRVARVGGAPANKAHWVMEGICHAMAAAHAAGIVHRDLKPENIFLARRHGARTRQQIKVLDFGIAKLLQEAQASETTKAIGTPAWLAPEQTSAGATITPATDVWAVGLLAYFVLTGKVFWQASASGAANTPQVLREILIEEIPPPTQRAIEQGLDQSVLPPGFDAWFLHCVARAQEQRFPDAAACFAAFEELFFGHVSSSESDTNSATTEDQVRESSSAPEGSGTQVMSEENVLAAALASKPRGAQVPAPPRAHDRTRRRPAYIAVALASVGVLGVLGFVALSRLQTRESVQEGDGSASPRSELAPTGGIEVAQQPAEVTKRASAMSHGREWFFVNEIDEATASKRHHFRALQRGGRTVRIERVDPTGQVQQTRVIEYPSSGGSLETVTDSAGTLIETVAFTADGTERHLARGGSPRINGCAQRRRVFDQAGDVLARECQDGQGHSIIDDDGCQVIRYEYDGPHRVKAERCFAADGSPSLDRYGAHIWRVERNRFGDVTEWAAYDIEERAVPDQEDGCTRTRYEFDDAGNRVAEKCVGPTGLVSPFHGVEAAVKKWTVDSHGCRLKEEYLTGDGRASSWGTRSSIVWSRDSSFVRFVVDAEVETLECAKLSEEERARSGDPPRRTEFTLNRAGEATERRCFESGQPCRDDEPAVVKVRFDDQGRIVSMRGFDSNGAPAPLASGYPPEKRFRSNDYGEVVEVTLYDAGGRLATAYGFAALRSSYDELGALVETSAWGPDGVAVSSEQLGMHAVRHAYDDRHRLTAIELRGIAGATVSAKGLKYDGVPWPFGSSRVEVIRAGVAIQNRFTGPDGKEKKLVDCAVDTPCYR